MYTSGLHISVLSFFVLRAPVNLSFGQEIDYTLTTKLLSTMSLSDPIANLYLEKWKDYPHVTRALIKYLIANDAKPILPKVHKTVTNLYSALKHFMDDKCLIVVNNFEGVDIYPTIEFPLILRQFDIAVGHFEYFESEYYNKTQTETRTLWVPKSMISKLNGNFSIDYIVNIFDCSLLKYLYSLWPVSQKSYTCAGPKSFVFNLLSRPWNCEIKVDLFILESLFRFGKHTENFDFLEGRYSRPKFLPSLRQPVHILVDTKSDLNDYDWVSLAAWIIKQYFEDENDRINNHVQILSHAGCQFKKIETTFECTVEKIHIIFPCPKCAKFVNIYPLKLEQLSYYYINIFDDAQKIVNFPAVIDHDHIATRSLQKYFSDYLGGDSEFIKFPLKNLRMLNIKFSDKLQILGFGYASIFLSFMGNVTGHTFVQYQDQVLVHLTRYLKRHVYTSEKLYDKFKTVVHTNNPFERTHFVSCGSRGIEPFAFDQLTSVFEWKVWVSILFLITLLTLSIASLQTKGFKIIGIHKGSLSMCRVLMEQGNPFPSSFDKDLKMRFLMSGTLLAALVISNSFKSENVYNIVLPRKQLSYHNLDELSEDNITLYVRYNLVSYYFRPPCFLLTNEQNVYYVEMCKESGFSVSSSTDVFDYIELFAPEHRKLYNYVQINTRLVQALIEPLQILDDLFQVGILNESNAKKVANGRALDDRFFDKQEDLVRSSLFNCSKTAWLLPDYLAQTLHRSLKKSGKHSDVSGYAYTYPTFQFVYTQSNVPSSILKRISWMATNGLYEWWPNFINRTGIILGGEHSIPPTPNMSGNIVVLFWLLGGGLSLAITCWVFEMWIQILFGAIFVYTFCATKLQIMIFRIFGFNERFHGNVVIMGKA